MPRVRSGVAHHRRVKKVLKKAKGYRGGRSKLYQVAREAVLRGEVYATVHRKLRKRQMRSLWITRLAAACRQRGISYNRFVEGLRKGKVDLDRKVLSEMAIHDPDSFSKIVEVARVHGSGS